MDTPRQKSFELISVWFEVLRDFLRAVKHNDVRIAWGRARYHIEEQRLEKQKATDLDMTSSENANVYGLMSNVMTFLLNLKWKPRAFNVWEEPGVGGYPWTLTVFHVATHVIAHKLIEYQNLAELRRARDHYNGNGIQDGIEWFSTLS